MERNPDGSKQIRIKLFRNIIIHLPSDEPQENPGIWYHTQKEHWLGWLGSYDGPGGYGRKNWNRDARFVYSHIVCPKMLMYLIRAIPLQPEWVETAEKAYRSGSTIMTQSGAIREIVPWDVIHQSLWEPE